MAKNILVRAGSGYGDSVYLRSIVKYYLDKGHSVTACSDYPDVFKQLENVSVVTHKKSGAGMIHAVYSLRKHIKGTDQFQDMCIQAGIKEPVNLKIDWVPYKKYEFENNGKQIAIIHPLRNPMSRKDGFGAELKPDLKSYLKLVDRYMQTHYCINIGRSGGESNPCHLDLINKTNLLDMFDLAMVADIFVGQCSHIIPIAESFDKKYEIMFSRAGLNSKNKFVSSITPEKIFHKKHLGSYVIDDEVCR